MTGMPGAASRQESSVIDKGWPPASAGRRKPFAAIRKGLIEHVMGGRLRGAGFAVYVWLHLQANHAHGTVLTNAQRLATELGFHPVTVRRVLGELRSAGYLRYEADLGRRHLYEIAIEKYHANFATTAHSAGLGGELHRGRQGGLHEQGSSLRRSLPNGLRKKETKSKTSTLRVRGADLIATDFGLSGTSGQASRATAVAALPAVLRETVELFLAKTGRQTLGADEVGALRDLEQAHTPAVIQRAISRAVDRFAAQGRPLNGLTFVYVAESLKHFRTRRPASPSPAEGSSYPPGLTALRLAVHPAGAAPAPHPPQPRGDEAAKNGDRA
jgi:hypothetical protein